MVQRGFLFKAQKYSIKIQKGSSVKVQKSSTVKVQGGPQSRA